MNKEQKFRNEQRTKFRNGVSEMNMPFLNCVLGFNRWSIFEWICLALPSKIQKSTALDISIIQF